MSKEVKYYIQVKDFSGSNILPEKIEVSGNLITIAGFESLTLCLREGNFGIYVIDEISSGYAVMARSSPDAAIKSVQRLLKRKGLVITKKVIARAIAKHGRANTKKREKEIRNNRV